MSVPTDKSLANEVRIRKTLVDILRNRFIRLREVNMFKVGDNGKATNELYVAEESEAWDVDISMYQCDSVQSHIFYMDDENGNGGDFDGQFREKFRG